MSMKDIFKSASMTFQMFGVEKASSLPELMNDMYNVQEELKELASAADKLGNASWNDEDTRAEMADAILDAVMFMMQASERWGPMAAPTALSITLAQPFVESLGYAFEASMVEVINSQRTKLCFNKDDLNDTLSYYNNSGVECHSEFITADFEGGEEVSYWLVKSSKMQFVAGKEYSHNKVLKNINTFKAPVLVKLNKE